MTSSQRLQHKVSIITGAAQGIGEACARLFAQEGAQVVLVDVQQTSGERLAAELRAKGQDAHFYACDIGDKTKVDELVHQVTSTFQRVDVLVSNAGIFRASPFLEISEDDFDAVLRVNLRGAFLIGQAVARSMKATGGGAIVHMSSVNAVVAIPEIATYNISKGGLNQLTRAMALALADDGIRVNAVAPGTIATELARQAVLTNEASRQKILSRTPLKRLGEPAEVAQVVAAGRQVGADAAAPALIAKMTRVFMMAPFLVGLALFLRYAAFWVFGANFRTLPDTLVGGSFVIAGIRFEEIYRGGYDARARVEAQDEQTLGFRVATWVKGMRSKVLSMSDRCDEARTLAEEMIGQDYI